MMSADATSQPSPERRNWLNDKQHRLLCRVELSAAYHGKRERFLTLCDRVCQAVAAFTATAAFSQVIGTTGQIPAAFMLTAAIGSILPLVFGWSSRANKHAILAADHRRLLSQVVGAGYELAEGQIVSFTAQLREIEASEDASLGALVVQCQNEMAIASGHADHVVPLRWWHRATMHVWDWHIEPPADKNAA